MPRCSVANSTEFIGPQGEGTFYGGETFHGRGLFLREGDPSLPPPSVSHLCRMPQHSTSLITIFPQLEIVVTKNFNSIMPQFQFEGQLLYEGRLLIFHQGYGLVTHMYTILYSSCSAIQYMHARCLLYTEHFRLKMQTFLYRCTFYLHENC